MFKCLRLVAFFGFVRGGGGSRWLQWQFGCCGSSGGFGWRGASGGCVVEVMGCAGCVAAGCGGYGLCGSCGGGYGLILTGWILVGSGARRVDLRGLGG